MTYRIASIVVSLIACLATAAEGRVYTVRASDCQLLMAHVPAAGVTYQPGVDVRGKPVVPADLAGPQIQVSESIDIVIGIDLADRIARRNGSQVREVLPFEGKSTLGVLSVGDNKVLWNGEPLETTEQSMLANACRDAIDSGQADETK